MNRSKILASALLTTAFVSGAIVGGAGLALADRARRPDDAPPKVSYLERLHTDLDLAPGQYVAVEGILELYNSEMHQLWAEVRPQADEIRANTRNEIQRLLDDEQVEIYEQMIAHSDSVRAERREKHDKK